MEVNNENESNGMKSTEIQSNPKVMNLLRRKIDVKSLRF